MNRSGAKGSAFARLIADYLAGEIDDRIDRRVQTGAEDKGDIGGLRLRGHRVVVECKNQARLELAAWLDETVTEARNDGALAGVLIHKRRGKAAPSEQYATLRLGDLVRILRAVETTKGEP